MAQESWKREKDGTDCKIPEGLILCINNCGLFGSPTTMNMCSKCYNESLLNKPNPPTPSSAPSPSSIQSSSTATILSMSSSSSQPATKHELLPESPSSSSSSASSSSLIASHQQIVEETAEREKAGVSSSSLEIRPLKTGSTGLRCNSCQRRVGLTGFRCRCGDLFCSRHRYSDAHNCSYDYKAAGREAIARDNPVVKAAKIIRI